jgi:hypothetical protein
MLARQRQSHIAIQYPSNSIAILQISEEIGGQDRNKPPTHIYSPHACVLSFGESGREYFSKSPVDATHLLVEVTTRG